MEVSHPTNEHECLTDDDSNMIPLWFDGDCMPKVLIDNTDLPDSEKSYNDYEEDFVINAKLCNDCYTLNGPNKLSKMYAALLILTSPLIVCFIKVLIECRTILHTLILVAVGGYIGILLIFICP